MSSTAFHRVFLPTASTRARYSHDVGVSHFVPGWKQSEEWQGQRGRGAEGQRWRRAKVGFEIKDMQRNISYRLDLQQ